MGDVTGTGAPPWATEPVRIVEHDPRWAGLAVRFAREVTDLFGPRLAGEVVHMSSTSVPDLPAKPIIDLQAVSADPVAALAEVGDAASAAGWRFVPGEYAQLKARAAADHGDDREAYGRAKTHFVLGVVRSAVIDEDRS